MVRFASVRAVERAPLDVEQQLLDLVALRDADREVVLPVEREERLAVDAELLERRPEALVAHAAQPHADLVARPLRDVVGIPVVLADDERLRHREGTFRGEIANVLPPCR